MTNNCLCVKSIFYRIGEVSILNNISADFASGTSYCVVGPSGSGKTTFMKCVTGVLRPQSGSIVCDGRDLVKMSDAERTALRAERFGFVVQSGDLVDDLTVGENLQLPFALRHVRPDEERIAELLERLGIAEFAARFPQQLSGGQRQRAAVARALVARPQVVFADEPTGALDSSNSDVVMDLLLAECARAGATLVTVTHDQAQARKFDHVIRLVDGRIG